MRAIVITEPGGPDVLDWQEVPDPVAGPGEVLIKVTATAVNRADLMQRKGFYDPPRGASPYPGLECSGTVTAVGDSVLWPRVGDTVCALLSGGGYAEKVAVPAGQVLPIPAGVDVITAGGLVEVAATVWSNLVLTAHLAPDETVLLHGGSSGIGTFAIQVARALGARVAVTAGSADKLERCRELGAQTLINYNEQDFAETLGSGSTDVVLDMLGAKYLSRNVDVLAPDGRLVIIGMQGGVKAELNIGALLGKRASVTGTTLRARPADQKAAICAEVLAHLWPMIEDGRVTPVVDRILPVTEAAAGHALMESSIHIGKIILQVC